MLEYCIDTSALIDLKNYYPTDVFPSLWTDIEHLIAAESLASVREVYKELEKKEDELFKWAKQHRGMFRDPDAVQFQHVREINREFPELVDPAKTTPDADPFIIALAYSENSTVITSEKPRNPGARPKIPDVCTHYKIKCIGLLHFFRERNFRL